MACWTKYKPLFWAKELLNQEGLSHFFGQLVGRAKRKSNNHIRLTRDLYEYYLSGSNLVESLVFVFAFRNEGWHSMFHSSVSAPNCLELPCAHGGSQTQAKNMQPTRYLLRPSSEICIPARSPPVSPSLSSLINCKFIPEWLEPRAAGSKPAQRLWRFQKS